jgi:hypothetical protein
VIGSILLCDRCGDTGGARASGSGRESRLARNRGTIRRVKLGRTFHSGSTRTSLRSLDLCKRCDRPDVIAEAQTRQESHANRFGDRFVRA